ncbi:MAG: hypothetical protein JWQ35_825, partial [Bacteriovoracaceae bacterium]|nr:hypothetical protein [Bacteriovoracaceae bacterium]
QLQTEVFDVLIIGGGITGAAVARDAAFRGLKVALIEAGDFASGTSSGSSKLIHGGVRYLEQFEFKLVFEAIQEREKLKKLYAPLVQDLSFVFPSYRNGYPPRWKLNLGLFLYDSFAKFRAPHSNLSASKTQSEFPWLKTENLTGSCVYTDSFSEDYRLVTELIKSAHRRGAICVSRLQLRKINVGPVHEILAADLFDRENSVQIKAKHIFNCSGPYSDSVRKLLNLPSALKLTQGIHFIIPRARLPIKTAFVLSDPKLNRILFAIPWNSITYLGTTDTEIDDPKKARASKADADYVLEMANHYFNVGLKRPDIIQSWAAVRPLLRPPDSRNPSAISREHHLEENPKNIFHLMGGKLTSHRLMAREALDHIKKVHLIDDSPLQDKLWEKNSSNNLETTFGRFSEDILQIDSERKLNQKTITSSTPHLVSEVLYSLYHEMALSPIDFIRRRSSLYYECPNLEMAKAVTDIFSKELHWTSELTEKHLNEVKEQFSWDMENY